MFVSDRGCLDHMSCSLFDRRKLLESSHIHISSYFNIATLGRDLPTLLKEAKEKGLSTSLNPQHDASKNWQMEWFEKRGHK